ncbi:MAG: ATP-binding cassette domain-containing protein, partial [Methylobacterium sp.]
MRLRQLEIVHAVYQHGSISAAARALGVSQPSVSKTLHHAEDNLGFRLFQLSRGRLVPTDEAHALMREAGDVFDRLNTLQQTARNLSHSGGGHIRLGIVPSLALDMVPQAMALFRRDWPRVTFEVHTHLERFESMTTTTDPSASAPAQAHDVLFRATGVKKHYPGVKALDGVDLEGYAGEVLAVCGANGAGKSTFAKLLAGVQPLTEGEIQIAGFPHPVRNAAEAEQAGVLMMFQEPLIIDDFTVGENVWLYKLREGRDIRPWATKVDANSDETRKVLAKVGLGGLRTDQLARDLGPGQRQMLSLSRAEVTTHKIMILDETTASTSEEHFNDILDLVRREREAGTHIMFVSHRLNEVFAMSDRIAVLRNGLLVDVLKTSETNPDEIATLMIGQALKAVERPKPAQTEGKQPLVAVRDLHGGTAAGVSFDVFPGEVVGLYGLVGSGR